jgi:alginate O-acetyltransferase complex protein AlgJ
LIESKNIYDNLLYYKLDSHWNELGASLAYRETINYLNNRYRTGYQTPEYSYVPTKMEGVSSADMLKISSLIRLADHLRPADKAAYMGLNFKIRHNVCLGDINRSSHELMPCKTADNPRYGINYHPQYTINSSPLNEQRALLLCDSFATANSRLYNATFSQLWKFSHWEISGSKLAAFVNKHKPNVVIYQIVERGLYNDHMITKLPNM